MITPLDIQNKEFSKGVRGYKEEEVNSFLYLISADMEKIMSENLSMKNKIDALVVDLEGYKKAENSMLETLEAAKALMRDISVSAEKRAEILLKNAELDAELITREAKESVERLTDESLHLQNRINTFRTKFRNLLESELEKIEGVSYDLLENFSTDNINKNNDDVYKTIIKEKEDTFIEELESGIDDMQKTMVNLKIEKSVYE